jgi:hypothetical protein
VTDAAVNAQLEGAFAAPSRVRRHRPHDRRGHRHQDGEPVRDPPRHRRRRLDLDAGRRPPANPSNVSIVPWIIGALGGFVLAMVITFTSRKKVRPALIFAYAAFEGLFVGGISAFFEFIWPGIVVQATLATLSVVGVTLALFASGKVRASRSHEDLHDRDDRLPRLLPHQRRLMMFGAFRRLGGAFGMLSNYTIAGIPLGHHRRAGGHHGRLLARARLRPIQQGVRNGAPRSTAGSAASASW